MKFDSSKSACIVDRDVNLDITAKRICSGKFINAGQTCIAPDYLLVHQEIKTALLDRLKFFIHEFYGTDPQLNADYPRIVNEKHSEKIVSVGRPAALPALWQQAQNIAKDHAVINPL